MRIKQKKSHKKILVFSAILILLISGGIYIFREDLGLVQRPTTKSEKNEDKENNDSKTEKENLPKEEVEEKNINPENPQAPKQFDDTGKKTDPNELTGSINLAEFDGQKLIIRTTIQQILGTGNCKISLTNGEKTYYETVKIIANPSSSSCAGFDIPKEKLGAGSWQFNIEITSGEKSGILSGKFNI